MAKRKSRARGSARTAAPAVAASATDGPVRFAFDIEWRNLETSGLNAAQQAMVRAAGERWSQVLDSFSAPVRVGNDVIFDLLVEVQLRGLPGNILAEAGPTAHRRPGVELPVKGTVTINSNKLDMMTSTGMLRDVVLHEVGHVLGIGTIAQWNALVDTSDFGVPAYRGQNARRAYAEIRGGSDSAPVPVEPLSAGPGSGGSHWAEQRLPNELMSPVLTKGLANPLSRITIAALQDLRYAVNPAAADSMTLPSAAVMAAMGISPMSISECGTHMTEEGPTVVVPLADG